MRFRMLSRWQGRFKRSATVLMSWARRWVDFRAVVWRACLGQVSVRWRGLAARWALEVPRRRVHVLMAEWAEAA